MLLAEGRSQVACRREKDEGWRQSPPGGDNASVVKSCPRSTHGTAYEGARLSVLTLSKVLPSIDKHKSVSNEDPCLQNKTDPSCRHQIGGCTPSYCCCAQVSFICYFRASCDVCIDGVFVYRLCMYNVVKVWSLKDVTGPEAVIRDAESFPGPASSASIEKVKEYVEKRAADGEEGERLLWSVAGLALQFKVPAKAR